MNYKVECIECQKTFTPTRNDAKTCGDACRSRYNRRKRKGEVGEILASPVVIEQPAEKTVDHEKVISGMEQRVKVKYSQVAKAKSAIIQRDRGIEAKRKQISEVDRQIAQLKKRLRMKDEKIIKRFIGPKYEAWKAEGNWVSALVGGFMVDRINGNRGSQEIEVHNFKTDCRTEINRLRAFKTGLENAIRELEAGIKQANEYIEVFKAEIDKTESRLKQLDELRFKQVKPVSQLRKVPTQQSRIQPKRNPEPNTSKAAKPSDGEIGGQDLLNMNFETFTLSGELGEFLGELDRNRLAIALTGDSGRGNRLSRFGWHGCSLMRDSPPSISPWKWVLERLLNG